ncbi:protein kinase domain-containing protein [Streptomyces avermitilis]|uniref:protein kinase domain-containing protein n=1 Tax=Streptomyces avermitilis TaxID=33903 RepID=UPI00371AC6F4
MAGETPEQGEGRIINGRYRLLRTLGAGGMGRARFAYDAEPACEVAAKEIALPDVPIDASEPVQRIARARSEARNAARLRGHPHVATVHDVVVHEGLPWIVIGVRAGRDRPPGGRAAVGAPHPAPTPRIGVAVLDALTAGHRIGILHRDVKPANILPAPDASGDPYARVLLTDYGIALRPESREPRLTATAGILGTPGYLALERARDEADQGGLHRGRRWYGMSRARPPCRDRRRGGPLPRHGHGLVGRPDEHRRLLDLQGGEGQLQGAAHRLRPAAHRPGHRCRVRGNKLCGNKFESSWAPGPARQVFGWIADKEDWNDGFDKVVCTVRRVGGAETSGKISAPGAV